ncbi:unnamed protein product [Malus baccata var. baccata]
MWKNSPKYDHPTILDPSNPHWGWSWLERWMAARPWESRSTAGFNDRASMRSAASRASMSVGEITKAYALRDKPFPRTPTALRSSRPSSRQSPSTPLSKAPLSASITRRTLRGNGRGGDEDSRSTLSIQSERFNRRFSMAGFSVRDHESLASSPSVQSYRTPTKPTKARSSTQYLLPQLTTSFEKPLNERQAPNSQLSHDTFNDMATPFLAGLAVAATALAGRYGIQAWHAFKTRPPKARMRKFYEGGFQPTMTKREAALILGVK